MKTPESPMELSSLMIESLQKPAAYTQHKAYHIQTLQTHSAWIILTGEYAYKVKKPVDFGFLDFSTLAKRKLYCEREVLLNQRFSKTIYISVEEIIGESDKAFIGRKDGEILDYAIKMHQFPADSLLSDLARKKLLSTEHIDQLISLVSKFHLSADKAKVDSIFGEPSRIKFWMNENFLPIIDSLFYSEEKDRVNAIQKWVEVRNSDLDAVFIDRKSNGFIRDCHGDLHLGNLTLIGGKVTPFDCIEFNDELRWIDVINEVAFLIMDLDEKGYSNLANQFLNGYLQMTGDYKGLITLSYYLVYRAVVKAKVAMLRRGQLILNSTEYRQATDEYTQYIQLASKYMAKKKSTLFITVGFSGTGKSTVASLLAQKFGLIQIRSDVERKRQAGLLAEEKTKSKIEQGLYTQDKNMETYLQLVNLAESVVDSGYSVVLDATFLEKKYRDLAFELANKKGVPLIILNCHAPQETLKHRITERALKSSDASEATLDVLQKQQSKFDDFDNVEKQIVIDIDTSEDDFLDKLLKHQLIA